jgi:hypothetical protein
LQKQESEGKKGENSIFPQGEKSKAIFIRPGRLREWP